MKRKKDIILVGSGLVGVILAIYLRKRGYDVRVFEKRSYAEIATRGQRSINMALSPRGIQALDQLSCLDIIQDIAVPMYGRMIHDLAGSLSFQSYGTANQHINSVSRQKFTTVLIDQAVQEGIAIFYEHECIAIDFEKTELTLRHDQVITKKKADIIIGVDGAFSFIRNAMKKKGMQEHAEIVLDYGYKELFIPAHRKNDLRLQKNALHIWPRKKFMFIALPNPDDSFVCTLFLPHSKAKESFEQLNTRDKIIDFFEFSFPDIAPLAPSLFNDFYNHPTSLLTTVLCYPWVQGNTLLFGDAAHAITPFYGQGMNAGFEDCYVLNQLLDKHDDDWGKTLVDFQQQRKPDNDAMAQLALDNFVEMRDWVADKKFLLQKKIEAKIHALFPNQWIPLYAMVTFEKTMKYSDAYVKGQEQQKIMDKIMRMPTIEQDWETLDYEKIIKKMESYRVSKNEL